MTTISNSINYCTLIHVFTVSTAKHLNLFKLLKEATEKVISKLPGYISVNLHISDDKRTITNYAQWATMADFKNMLNDEEAKRYLEQASKLFINHKQTTYTTIWTHSNE